MGKKHWYIYIVIFTLLSCDNFVLKKEHKEEIVKERLDKLNLNEVEQPPLFEICKGKSEEQLEQCFQNIIAQHFHNHLSKQEIKIKKPVKDTIWVPLLITKNGEIIIEDFELPDPIASQIPNLKDILEEGINSLPKVAAAHTRSTPVTALYKLPLVIHID